MPTMGKRIYISKFGIFSSFLHQTGLEIPVTKEVCSSYGPDMEHEFSTHNMVSIVQQKKLSQTKNNHHVKKIQFLFDFFYVSGIYWLGFENSGFIPFPS